MRSTPHDEEERSTQMHEHEDGRRASNARLSTHEDRPHTRRTACTHEHAHAPLPIDQREVTSILVLCNSPLGPTVLDDGDQQGRTTASPRRCRRRAKWQCS